MKSSSFFILIKILGRNKWFYLLSSILFILVIFLRTIEPKVFQLLMDEMLVQSKNADTNLIYTLNIPLLASLTQGFNPLISTLLYFSLLYLMLTFARSVIVFGANTINAASTENALSRLRDQLFSHLQSISIHHYIHHSKGEIIQRSTNDLEVVKSFIQNNIVEVIRISFLLIANALSERYMQLESGRLRHYVICAMRSQMFSKMQNLSYQYYDKSSAGWLVARLTYDTERLSEVISWVLISFIGSVVMIASCLISMFILNIPLTIIVLLSIPVILLTSIRLKVLVLKYARDSRRLNSELTGYFTENLNAIELVKSNAIEDYRNEGFSDINNRLRNASLKTSVYSSFLNPVLVLLGSLVAGIIMFVGGKMTFAGIGAISIGTFGAFFAYVRSIFMPIFDISRAYSSVISSLSAGERIFSLIDEPVTIKDFPDAITDFSLSGDILFENVNFGYLPRQGY